MRWTAAQDARIQSLYVGNTRQQIADQMGLREGQVRSRLWTLGIAEKVRPWSATEIQRLRLAYTSAVIQSDIGVPALAAELGRDEGNISRKAGQLGLTRPNMPKVHQRVVKARKFNSAQALREHRSQSRKAWHISNPHPRGMLGKKHSPEVLTKMADGRKKYWREMTEEKLAVRNLKRAKTRAVAVAAGLMVNERKGCSWKAGWREIGRHRKYFRSRWEANYAYYLQFLLERGDIEDWEHESDTFWFEGVRRGACSYLPDFKVIERGLTSYHEVKGWMDDRSKTKIARMAKYHPGVRLIVVQEKQYKEIANKLGSVIPGWEK